MADGRAPEGHGQMGLADPGRPEQEEGVAVGHPAPGGQFPDLTGVERGLGGEVEVLQAAQVRKVGDAAAHVDALLLLVGDLGLAPVDQDLASGQLAPGGLVEEVV